MKIIGVIPARYASSRFPGKPLADICGKPMIWWVYQQVKKVKELDAVYVATDSDKIIECLNAYQIPSVLTSNTHASVFNRVHEVSDKIFADAYVIINGDEPLVNPTHIAAVIQPQYLLNYATNTIAKISSPAENMDTSNIKVVFDNQMNALFMSRNPIPCPYKSINFSYWKHVGITAINKKLLDFYQNTPAGEFEKIEGIDHMRLIEYGQKLKFIKIDQCNSLSVDTPKDLDKVRELISQKINNGEILL